MVPKNATRFALRAVIAAALRECIGGYVKWY
jgi:hypothetical protein